VGGAFGFGHDDLQTYVSAPIVNAAKESTTAERRVRVSNEEDYFRDMEKTYPVLPSQAVSYGNEWDLLVASMNETTAKVRRATEKLRAAEALAAVVSLRDKNFMKGLSKARDAAWETYGKYWEHNWTADGPVSRKARADWQVRMQSQLTAYVDTLYERSIANMGAQLSKRLKQTFFVFNPLGWVRTDVADVAYSGRLPVRVTEVATGKEVLFQMVTKGGMQYIRIRAENVPSVGYKTYCIKPGNPVAKEPAATYADAYLTHPLYKLKLNGSGAITELFDLRCNRQLVKAIDGRYLNDIGSNGDGEITIENSGPVSFSLKAVSKNPLPHTVRITVYARSNRIDIEDSIGANFGDLKTWGFSFNLDKPTTRHEELGAVLTVKKESRGGHYADENARYDYQTFNHFADLSEGGYGVTLSNRDCSFFKLGRSSVDSLWETSSQLNALAGGNVDRKLEDGGVLGILNQNGQKEFLYQFALTTHQKSYSATDAIKFSLEHQTPLVTGMVTGSKSAASARRFSLLTISDPNVLLWSLKPPEDGPRKGLVARVWNMSNSSAQPILHFAKRVQEAWRTSHIETDAEALKPVNGNLQARLRSQQIGTYKVVFAK
jgi:alpha-mannosidase